MAFTFTKESLNSNISSFWSTYMQEISRQGDLLRKTEVEPLCRRLGIGFDDNFFDRDGNAVLESEDKEVQRITQLLEIPIPGTEYSLGDFVSRADID